MDGGTSTTTSHKEAFFVCGGQRVRSYSIATRYPTQC